MGGSSVDAVLAEGLPCVGSCLAVLLLGPQHADLVAGDRHDRAHCAAAPAAGMRRIALLTALHQRRPRLQQTHAAGMRQTGRVRLTKSIRCARSRHLQAEAISFRSRVCLQSARHVRGAQARAADWGNPVGTRGIYMIPTFIWRALLTFCYVGGRAGPALHTASSCVKARARRSIMSVRRFDTLCLFLVPSSVLHLLSSVQQSRSPIVLDYTAVPLLSLHWAEY